MDIKEQIKQISFSEIFRLLWLKTFKKWIALEWIYDNWVKTSWWTYDMKNNLVNDLSKDRAKGDQIKFVSEYLNMDFKDTLLWFKANFWLKDNENIKLEPIKEIKSNKAIEYLKSRWINYDRIYSYIKFSNINWKECISLNMIKDWSIVWRQSRSIEGKWFSTEWQDWYFFNPVKIGYDDIFVVEWMTDYLSLRQYIPNVIWIKSASTNMSEKMLEYINNFDKVYLLIDNDKAWKTAKEKIRKELSNKVYEIQWEDKIDVNDMCIELWDELVEWIKSICTVTKQPEFDIITYAETLEEWIIELEKTNPKECITWGYDSLDNKLWYILAWQLIVLGGTTWSGKTSFSSEIAKNISKQGNKVLKFTLEDRLQDKKKQELYYEIARIRRQSGKQAYPYNDFISNNLQTWLLKWEIDKAKENLRKENKNIYEIKREDEKQIDLVNLEKIIKKWINIWCKLVVLDHLQEFKVEWNQDRHDLKIEEMMYTIKNIARKYNIAIILIAHFKKVEWKPTENSFKDSVAITQVANKVLLLYRDKLNPDSLTELLVVKNRERPDWTWVIEMNFDKDNLRYKWIKSKKQIELEEFNF